MSALEIVERFKANADAPSFHVAWAKVIVDQNDVAQARQMLKDPSFRTDAVRGDDPATLYRLLKLGGGEPGRLLEETLDAALSGEDISKLRDVAEIFDEEGKLDAFELRARGRLSSSLYEHVIEDLRRRRRHPRFFR